MGTDGYKRSTVKHEPSVLVRLESMVVGILTLMNHICEVLHALQLIFGWKSFCFVASERQRLSA